MITPEHKHMKTIAKLLKTSNKIVKDECEDPIILGKKGKVCIDFTFWYIYIIGTQRWNKAKKDLSFMSIWQDGDTEGVLRADFPPSPKQSTLIRKYVGLGKKRIMSKEHRERMKKYFYPSASSNKEIP